MYIRNKDIRTILEKYKEISLLNHISALLGWDLSVNLPINASSGRGKQSAYITEKIVNLWLDPEFKKLIEQDYPNTLNNEEKGILRNLRYGAKYYYRVPKDIIVEKERTSSEAYPVWQKAKQENKFEDFLPYLKKLIELNQIIAEHIGYSKNPYDALLDRFEPEFTYDQGKVVFGKLQPALTSLIKRIKKSKLYFETDPLLNTDITYPQTSQNQLLNYVVRKMGYDYNSGRIDISSHPFTTNLDRYDVRFTVKYLDHDFRDSITSGMHEAGHALYEQAINPDFSETPLEGGVSLGIHECLSRFWENMIGKNPSFLKFATPLFQAFYTDQLKEKDDQTIARLFNQVVPGFIRIEADEVTYSLHIILRFEIENELINGKLKPEDLPEAWNEKMKKYLGIAPETNSQGVLQDVHWAYGEFGYFPAYALGNLYGAQFLAKMKKEIPFEKSLEKGELATVLYWLNENIHQHGSLYFPAELVKKVTGKPLDSSHFINYLENKYSEIYKLKKS
jgi:carboxypeptidase Taq